MKSERLKAQIKLARALLNKQPDYTNIMIPKECLNDLIQGACLSQRYRRILGEIASGQRILARITARKALRS